ncbi:MAG TPA: efflux RND transporter periplasmic adaptor subunit [Labilithrix sp.]
MKDLALVLIAGSLLLFEGGCRKPDDAKAELTSAKTDAPVQAQTVKVGEQPMPEYLTLTGTLKASEESEIAADASGKVTATFVERGQHVKRGDTLAVLDSRGAALTANAMTAQTNLAKAQLEQAQKECERVKQLFQSGSISQAEFDRTSSTCQTSTFAAAAAQAQQQNAQKIVGDAIIRAPFSGVVGERFVSVGQYVQPQTKVASLYAPDPLRLELTVPEANVGALAVGMPVKFTVAAFGDENFTGAVKFISPNIRPTTRDLVIEALCPNADLRLRPGMFAVARLEINERPMAAVPATSVKKDDTTARVFAVVDGRAQERIVQLAGERDGKVGVIVGVKPGDSIIDKPSAEIHDGVQVR